jgi:hypothetical protein
MDTWASFANQGYTACTVCFIDKDSWQLHLHYKNMVAVVTDTEAAMISAGRLFVENSARVGGMTGWHGCADHYLQLATGVAFKDLT